MTSPITALPARMINAYFSQNEQYFSTSKEVFLKVSEMHPTHAANAAARYVADAATWALEAGVEDVAPNIWMVRQPLFLALVRRANLS